MTAHSDAGWCRWDGDDLILQVRVQPRASRDECSGVQGQHLKIRLTAPPVDGKANTGLIAFLAKRFKVPKSQVQLLSGETSREKRLRIRKPAQLPDFIPQQ